MAKGWHICSTCKQHYFPIFDDDKECLPCLINGWGRVFDDMPTGIREVRKLYRRTEIFAQRYKRIFGIPDMIALKRENIELNLQIKERELAVALKRSMVSDKGEDLEEVLRLNKEISTLNVELSELEALQGEIVPAVRAALLSTHKLRQILEEEEVVPDAVSSEDRERERLEALRKSLDE